MISDCPTFDVLVIGSGPAGQNAALEAAEQGARVLIIEQEPQVGGACVQFGTIPSKTLRETALTLAARDASPEVVRALLASGAEASYRNANRANAGDIARSLHRDAIAELLSAR